MERIWIFPSSKPLTGELGAEVEKSLNGFLSDWAAHGRQLDVHYKIEYNHFIIIQVDEQMVQASGCSIDSMTRFMQELDQKYNLHLFDRQKVAFLKDGMVEFINLQQLPELYKSGDISVETEVFNNLIQRPSELKNLWHQPLKESPYAPLAGVK